MGDIETPEPSTTGWPRSAQIAVGVLSAVAIVAVVIAATGIGGDEITEPDATSSAVVLEESPAPATAEEPTAEPSADPATPHEFGESADLRGSGTTVTVTPETYFKSLVPDPYGYVEDHQKLIGIMVSFKNAGGRTYEINAGYDMVLIDSKSGQWESDYEVPQSGSACSPELVSTSLPSGAERRGCLTFTLPKNATPASLQVQLDAGSSGDIATWKMPSNND